jgi:hypothetical protein
MEDIIRTQPDNYLVIQPLDVDCVEEPLRIDLLDEDLYFLTCFVTKSSSNQYRLNPNYTPLLEDFLSLLNNSFTTLRGKLIYLVLDSHCVKPSKRIVLQQCHKIDFDSGVISAFFRRSSEKISFYRDIHCFYCTKPPSFLFRNTLEVTSIQYQDALKIYESRGLFSFFTGVHVNENISNESAYWSFIIKNYINHRIEIAKKEEKFLLPLKSWKLSPSNEELKSTIIIAGKNPESFSEIKKIIKLKVQTSVGKIENDELSKSLYQLSIEKAEILKRENTFLTHLNYSENDSNIIDNASISNLSIVQNDELVKVAIPQYLPDEPLFPPSFGVVNVNGVPVQNSFFSFFFNNFSAPWSTISRCSLYSDIVCDVLRWCAAPGFPFSGFPF